MTKVTRIFIIGHPGAGKGLVAKTLAEKLGWKCIDADFGLEPRIGRLLSGIIGEKGEQALHDCENDMLKSMQKQDKVVVVTDASIVDNATNMDLLKNAYTVYIQVSTPVQLERMSRNQPPLLMKSDMQAFLDQLHKKRDRLYEEIASLTINSDDSKLDEHVSMVVSHMNGDKQEPAQKNLKLNKKDKTLFHKKSRTPIELTQQQAMCLKLLAQGKSSKEIASELELSHRTVESYIAKTKEILGCASVKELIALYHDQP